MDLGYLEGLIGALRELPHWLKRVLVYGLLLACVLSGLKAYQHLRSKISIEYDARGTQTYGGDLGGRGLELKLAETGSDKREVSAILKAIQKHGGQNRQFPGDSYELVRSTSEEFLHLTLVRGLKKIVVTPDEKGFSVSVSSVPVALIHLSAKGPIKGNLWISMQKQGVPTTLIQEFADIFQWSVDFLTETQDGDRFAMTWSERHSPDGRVWGRTIEAGVYDGRVAGRSLGIQFMDGYYDARGESLQSMFLKAPLSYRRISSYFSSSRYHPILKKRRPHHGIDYAAPYGTPVSAIGSGVVARKGYLGAIGNAVEVRHNGTYTTLYGHLKAFAKGIAHGVRVRQGQVLGYVGSTGLSTGPHLHFQFSQNGRPVNFMRIRTPRERSVPKAKMAEFAALRERRLREMGEFQTELTAKESAATAAHKKRQKT